MSSAAIDRGLYLGLISGTSVDAIDCALADFENGPRLHAYAQVRYPPELADALRAMAVDPDAASVTQLSELDARVGDCFAEAALLLLRDAGREPAEITAIGSHGQTVFHRPGPWGNSLQIGDPSRIAWRTGVTTVADFRRMDLAAGGQGAPLVPTFHAAVFRSKVEDRAILNLGGIANLTLLPRDPSMRVRGFDTGPANALMDEWANAHLGASFDDAGAWAAGGAVNGALLERLLGDPYFRAAPPKSTGRDYFNLAWVRARSGEELSLLPPQDVQATLARLTARSVADALLATGAVPGALYACGGGAHNATLMNELQAALPRVRLNTTASMGVDPDRVEALAFAWLAKRRLDAAAGNLPDVTGAGAEAVLGGVYRPRPA